MEPAAGGQLASRRRRAAAHGPAVPSANELLHRVAEGDVAAAGSPGFDARAASGLDRETFELVQIAALAAVSGSPSSWLAQLERASDANVGLDRILGTLIGIEPIVGQPKVVAAAARVVRAEDLD